MVQYLHFRILEFPLILVAFHFFPAFFTRRGGQVALQTARRERRRAAGSAGVVAWRSGETGKVLERMDIWYGYMVWIKKIDKVMDQSLVHDIYDGMD
jgi:hypothetical protein